MSRGVNRLWDAPFPTGYRVGPIISHAPWHTGWERDPRIDDGHPHRWETVLIAPRLAAIGPGGEQTRVGRIEEVVRCSVCRVPRCGHSTDRDPCMLRRHHTREHVLLYGTVRRAG